MGKRSFVCRSSLGGQWLSACGFYFFSVFGFFVVLCWCFDLWGHCLSPKNIFFSKWFMFQGLWAILNLHFLIHVIFLGLYVSSVDIFVQVFVWEFLWRMFYLYNMYHVECVYLSGIQGSMICAVDRNQILCDITFWDHIIHPTCMVNGLQLQYWHSLSIYHISRTIQHRYKWYCLLHIFEHFCHIKFQFSFFVYVIIKL